MNVWQFLGLPEGHRPREKTVQLVKHREQANQSKLKLPVIGQTKKDGVYCMLVYSQEKMGFFGRSGLPLSNLEHLRHGTEHNDGDCILISELCNKHFALEELSGIVNPNRSNPLTDEEFQKMQDCELHVHDYVPLADFIKGSCRLPYEERNAIAFYSCAQMPSLAVLHVPSATLFSEGAVEEFSNSCILHEEEGAVFKDPSAGWVAGRKDHTVTKIVRGVHYDLEIVGVEEGKKGKRLGMVGNLLVRWREYGREDGKVVVLPVDGKYTDAQRIAWLKEPEQVVGKLLHVKALQIGSKGALRLPKGQEVRVDKHLPDL